MASFLYKAMTGEGVMAEGSLEAGGRQEAIRQLEGKGLSPIEIAEGSRKHFANASQSTPIHTSQLRTNGVAGRTGMNKDSG